MAKNDKLEFAISLAREAGKMIKDNFKLNTKINIKEDNSEVTETDIAVNNFVIKSINKKYPEHNILAEEGSSMAKKSDFLWICDPIDGTISFSHGIPTCVFSLALTYKKEPILCAIYDPFLDRMFYAEKGKGAFLNGNKISVSDEADLDDSLIGHCNWKGAKFNTTTVYAPLIEMGADVLDLGSTIYMGVLVACGKFDAVLFPQTSVFEAAALKVLIEEAGGKASDLYGKDQDYTEQIKGFVASNGLVHEQLIELVKRKLND